MPRAELTRRISFCAAHRLHSTSLTDSENKTLFGKCNQINGHGHNYILEVTVRGEIDPKTGIVMDLSKLKQILDEAVMQRIDHKNLNLDVEEFASLNPTAENIAVCVWSWIERLLPKGLLYQIKLYETENNAVIYRGE
jgi:6-pyruvoyltetrahydropterin/6-carboxytetrahydropterin synthase